MAYKEVVELNSFAVHLQKVLEKLLLKLNGFALNGADYDLILLIPLERYAINPRYSLMLSAPVLSGHTASEYERIKTVLVYLREMLSPAESQAISNVNILDSYHPLVRIIKQRPSTGPFMTELEHIDIGGDQIEYAIRLRSATLSKLKEGRAVQAILSDEVFEPEAFRVKTVPMGLVRMQPDFNVVYYTGIGLNELYPQKDGSEAEKEKVLQLRNLPEETLFERGYLAEIDFDRIHHFE